MYVDRGQVEDIFKVWRIDEYELIGFIKKEKCMFFGFFTRVLMKGLGT